MFKEMEKTDREGGEFNPIYIMADSGARGSQAADPPAGRHARPDGAALGRDHREPHHLELPRRPDRAAVLHLDPRRPQGPGRHRAQDRRLRLPDPPPGGREPGRDHQRARLRHAWTASTSSPSSSRARSSSRCATASSAASAWRTSRTRSAARCIVKEQRGDHRGDGQRGPGRRHREGAHPLGAHLRVAARRVRALLRPRPGHRQAGGAGHGGGRHRRPVDRRAGHAAHHAHVPHRRHRQPPHRADDARGQERRHRASSTT